MTYETRLAFRASPADLANLTTIAAALRVRGQHFCNRTEAMRYALDEVAKAFAVSSPK